MVPSSQVMKIQCVHVFKVLQTSLTHSECSRSVDVIVLVLRASSDRRNSSSIDRGFSSNKRWVKKVIFFVLSFNKNETQHIFFFKVKDFPVHLMQGIVFSVKRARRQFY